MGTAEVQGDLWNSAAADWAALQEPGHTPLFRAMLDAAQVGAGTRVLDIGCGGGTASVLADERGAQVSGIDAASELIRIAAKRVPAGDFRVGDLETLPHEDDTFDVVFAANALQYAADHVNALREMRRVCKSGGQIIVGLFGEPLEVEYRAILKAVADSLPTPPKGFGPFGLSQPGKLDALFQAAGLEITLRGHVNCPMRYENHEVFWRATRSGGGVIGAIRAAGEERVRESVLKAVTPFVTDDSAILIQNNRFQFVGAQL